MTQVDYTVAPPFSERGCMRACSTSYQKDLEISGCVFSGNQAWPTGDGPDQGLRTCGGGAVFLFQAGVDVTRCTFYDNRARWGGAIYSTGVTSPGAQVSISKTIIASGNGETARCFSGGSVTDVGCSDFNGNTEWGGIRSG